MPEMKVTTNANGHPIDNPRQAIRAARMDRMRRINETGRPGTVKVFAANEDMRRVLRHANGTRFRADLGEAVEWPNDSFTARRLAEGSVRTEAASGEQAAPDPKLSPREQANARKPKPAEATTASEPKRQQKSASSSS